MTLWGWLIKNPVQPPAYYIVFPWLQLINVKLFIIY